MLASLVRWNNVLSKIPVPAVNNEDKQEIYVQALQGDKILGCAVTTTLIQKAHRRPVDTGGLTQVISGAVSNSFLAQHADSILLPCWKRLDLDTLSEWEIATLVEAAVWAVHQVDPSAVHSLATFLLDAHANSAEDSLSGKAKSRLLELGGSVTAKRTAGGDHNPVFTATATWKAHTAKSQGPSKKRAETLAAARLLAAAHVDVQEETVWEIWSPMEETSFTYNKWEPLVLAHTQIKLKNGETPTEWWIRGAQLPRDALRRAVMAPKIFPDMIAAVDSWVRRRRRRQVDSDESDDEAAVFAVIVTTNGQHYSIPVATGASANQARRIVGLAATRIIAQLVDLTLLPSPQNDE